MKFSDIEVLVKHLSDPIKKYVSNLVNPINKKIQSLEESLNSIKAIDVDDIALTAAGLIDKPKDGLNGKDGANGLDGKDGKDGANGKDGLDGKSFLDHIKELGYGSFDEFKNSIMGLDGKNGKDGQDGENGKSFIEQLPELGYPTIEDFISSLQGIDGKDGRDGIDGKSFLDHIKELGYVSFEEFNDSIKGHDGKDGENGVDGKDGTNGIDGLNGQDGINGKDGIDGKDGVDGKDALDIDILPEINESETYQRGTYATHNGGLWRSHQTTKGLRGWECIVTGISEIEIEQVDERNFKLKLTKSDNNVIEKSFSMPVMIYKGVFKSGESYQKGDTVTWGGSMWHCDADTTDKPGELESKGWTLATKRGRDGKDKQ